VRAHQGDEGSRGDDGEREEEEGGEGFAAEGVPVSHAAVFAGIGSMM